MNDCFRFLLRIKIDVNINLHSILMNRHRQIFSVVKFLFSLCFSLYLSFVPVSLSHKHTHALVHTQTHSHTHTYIYTTRERGGGREGEREKERERDVKNTMREIIYVTCKKCLCLLSNYFPLKGKTKVWLWTKKFFFQVIMIMIISSWKSISKNKTKMCFDATDKKYH